MATQITDAQDLRSMRRQLGTDAIDLASVALALGWRINKDTDGSLALSPPVALSTRAIHLSAKNKGGGRMDALRRTVIRYGDQRLVRRMQEAALDPTLSGEEFAKTIALSSVTQGIIQQFDAKEAETQMAESIKADVVVIPDPPKPTPDPPKPKMPTQHIIAERPALMHSHLTQHGGKSYPSKTTVERVWSDKTVDYRCAVASCDFTSDNRLSFRGQHWAMHIRKGEAEQVKGPEENDLVDDPNYTEAAYSKPESGNRATSRMQIIASYIKALDPEVLTKMDAKELAETLTRLFEKSGGVEVTSEPLTAEQVLDRIRRLVDTGKYAEQEATILAQRQVLEASKEVYEAEHSRAKELEARALRAEGNLTALRELLNDDAVSTT